MFLSDQKGSKRRWISSGCPRPNRRSYSPSSRAQSPTLSCRSRSLQKDTINDLARRFQPRGRGILRDIGAPRTFSYSGISEILTY